MLNLHGKCTSLRPSRKGFDVAGLCFFQIIKAPIKERIEGGKLELDVSQKGWMKEGTPSRQEKVWKWLGL